MKRDHERERRGALLLVATGLPALSALFLWLEHVTHFEFLLHLAAIPLEILLGAFLVERWLARKEKEGKRRQLLYLKSYLFRSEMRQVFLSNFERAGRAGDLDRGDPRGDAARAAPAARRDQRVAYRSDEDMERVVLEYARARHAFQVFMEWAAPTTSSRSSTT